MKIDDPKISAIDKSSHFRTTPDTAIFTMPHRAPSPAASENEFDITNALFDGTEDAGNEDFAILTKKPLGSLDAGDILDLENASSGDEAFISAQQAAANRKGSNLKGKSVKKGGGFQAMGSYLSSISAEDGH